jgi:hypothetical protein
MISKLLLLLATGLLALCRPGQAYKVMVAPGKTECISQMMEAAHFEVSTLSLGRITARLGVLWASC